MLCHACCRTGFTVIMKKYTHKIFKAQDRACSTSNEPRPTQETVNDMIHSLKAEQFSECL